MNDDLNSGAVTQVPHKVRIPCLRCNQPTWHEIVAEGENRDYDIRGEFWSAELYRVVRCCGCQTHSFMLSDTDASMPEGSNSGWSVYPSRGDINRTGIKDWQGLPSQVRRLYRETCDALRNSQPVLAAIGIRALVEAVCRQRRAKGRTLKQRIDNLVAKEILTPTEANVLHRTRFLGNRAAHQATPASDAILDAAMRIAEHLLTTVYLIGRVAKVLPRS